MFFDDPTALAVHAAWPTGKVHRPLADEPPTNSSLKERKRARDKKRQALIREYARQHGVSDVVARKHFKDQANERQHQQPENLQAVRKEMRAMREMSFVRRRAAPAATE
jgi:hypothetical protein